MSKRIAILEGQSSKQFGGVKQLITELPNSGDCIWVPEDEVRLTTKRIEKNGKYYAKNEKDADKKAFYGFSSVTVAISSKTSGTKNPNPPSHSGHDGDWNYPSDGDGNEYGYDTGPDSGSGGGGDIIETALPSRISITTPPIKTLYNNGDTIHTAGMVVTAYKNDGTVWGNVPLTEITIDPKVASFDGAGSREATSRDLDWRPYKNPIEYSDAAECTHSQGTILVFAPFVTGFRRLNISPSFYYVAANRTIFNLKVQTISKDGEHMTERNIFVDGVETGSKYTHDGKTVYYYAGGHLGIYGATCAPDIYPSGYSEIESEPEIIAWVMVFGDQIRSEQEVTVKWNRPQDNKELTDKFKIYNA